ncbi:uncharacterized protein LOC142591495 [Dermacentor variabilis]|uniref:uncharacterized protein LOC142591495 n=1 Tax=Dermacentor variabilis TaxID=34621 RepID=UPI003F5C9BC9
MSSTPATSRRGSSAGAGAARSSQSGRSHAWKEYVTDDDEISPPVDKLLPDLFHSTMSLRSPYQVLPFRGRESYDEEPTPVEGSDAADQAPSGAAGQPASIVMALPSAMTARGIATQPSQMTPTRNRWLRSPLICTVSVKFTNVSSIPGDGLCDFIFYESFYLKNNPTGWSDSGLDHFLRLSKSMRMTGVGASFSPVKDTLFSDALSGNLNAAVDNLRRRGVSHFGMLSLYRRYISSPKFFECLRILQDIREHVNSQVPSNMPTPAFYTVVGALFDEPLLYQNLDRSKQVVYRYISKPSATCRD